MYLPVNNVFDITVFHSGFNFNWSPDFVFNGERHNYWEAVYVDSGEVEVTEDGNVYKLKEGELIFHAPNEFHRIKSSGGTSPTGFITSFEVSGELPEVIKSGVFKLEGSFRNNYVGATHKIHEFLYADNSDLTGMFAASQLKIIIIKLDIMSAKSKSVATQSALEYKRLISLMTKTICENLTLEEVSKRANVSVSYIKYLFKTYAGITPKNYLTQLKVHYANNLLAKGLTVSEIAEKMNFSSPSYFSTYYKKHHGVSPSKRF